MSNCSIIIPHYNNPKIILRCLKSLIKYTSSKHEIIIIDDASNDDSVDIIKNDYPNIEIIQNKKNLGYAESCNLGAIKAKNEYIVFLNNDTEVTKNWEIPLIDNLKNEEIASVQPKIKNLINKDYFDYAGASGGYLDILCYPFCRGRIFDTIEKDVMQYESNARIFWASGAAFATKKEIFIKSGMFDGKLYAHMEEIDYHWRSQMMGYKISIIPESIIYHEGGKTLSNRSYKKTYLNHRNSLILFLSNHKISTMLLFIAPRLLLHLISTLVDFVCFRFRHSYAQVKSLLWVLFHVPYIIKKRFHNKKIMKKDYVLEGLYKKSIVFNYFILNKYFFRDY